MHKTSAWPLALIYAALIVYASLYPFEGWRDQGIAPWAFLASPLPRYWTGFDVAANVVRRAWINQRTYEITLPHFYLPALENDLITYTSRDGENHLFRVLETAALVIRRPSAICTITG